MADVTISALPAVTTVVPGTDVLPLVSNSGATTTKATPNQVVQAVLAAPGTIGGNTPAVVNSTQLVATGGAWTQGVYSGTYTDGVVVDYVAPNGRISVGPADTLTFYTGGVATTQMMVLTSTGVNSTPIGATTPSTGVFTKVTTSAGTNAIAPINLTAGTNLTSATAGTVEYDGTVVYATPTANCRGVVAAEQFITLTAPYTLVAQLAAQKIFNSSTNGAVTLPVGTFAFECEFNMSAMSSTAGSSFGFALGGTATFTQYWTAIANKAAAATAAAPQATFNTTANTTIATGSTATTGYARITGQIVVTVAGTLIPQVSQVTAFSAAIVGIGSFFRIRPLGSSTVTTVGNWS